MTEKAKECVELNARLRKKKEVQKFIDLLQGRDIFYRDKVMKLHAGFYVKYNNLVLTIFDPEDGPFANITVNIEELPADEFAVDVNNFPDALGILVENKIAEYAGKQLRSGYCIYPVYRLLLDNERRYYNE